MTYYFIFRFKYAVYSIIFSKIAILLIYVNHASIECFQRSYSTFG